MVKMNCAAMPLVSPIIDDGSETKQKTFQFRLRAYDGKSCEDLVTLRRLDAVFDVSGN